MEPPIKSLQDYRHRATNLSHETWGVVITTFFGALGIVVTVNLSKGWEFIAITSILSASVGFLCYTTLKSINLAVEQSQHIERLRGEKEAVERNLTLSSLEYESLKRHVNESDRAFRELATRRMQLDTDFFILSQKEDNQKHEGMAASIGKYFDQVCSHVVDVIAARLKIDKDELSVDIKIISDNGKMYRAVARSTPHSLEARERMTRRAAKDTVKRDLMTNLHLKLAIESNKHENLIEDLTEWRRRRRHNYYPTGNVTAPPDVATEYYKTSLTVSMYIDADDKSENSLGLYGREAKVNSVNERIYGFISVDSPSNIEFSESEKSLMHEIAVNTLSVIRFYDILFDGNADLLTRTK